MTGQRASFSWHTSSAVLELGTLEKPLLERSKINLNEASEKPFTVAGTVRGTVGRDSRAAAELKIFTGDPLLVKRYEFRVKK